MLPMAVIVCGVSARVEASCVKSTQHASSMHTPAVQRLRADRLPQAPSMLTRCYMLATGDWGVMKRIHKCR